MIELRKISKVYPPEERALDHLSLTIRQGEFACIAGASGAGKSTLLKILFGEVQPSSGEALVAGRNMHSLSGFGMPGFRRDVGFVFQDYKLLQERTVLENVAFPLEVCGVPTYDRNEIGYDLLKIVSLEHRATNFPATLSGGEQQRVAVLRALINQPKLLLADEPTGNLDPKMTQTIFELLMAANQSGVTIVVASHDLAVIEQMKLRTIVLDKGRIIGDFTP